MNDFSNLRLIRTESVNGKSTRHYTGDIEADGDPNLVGCRAGAVIIEIHDPENGRRLLRRYFVTVSGGPLTAGDPVAGLWGRDRSNTSRGSVLQRKRASGTHPGLT